MPEIKVCPVSSSDLTLNVGSSSDNFIKASPNLSWSALVLGSIAIWITGSGNTIFSNKTLSSSVQRVSPVFVFFNPTIAAISPALISSKSSLLSACIKRILPTLSFLSETALYIYDPAFNFPL